MDVPEEATLRQNLKSKDRVVVESSALYFSLAVTVLTFGIALLLFWGKSVPIYERVSIGTVSALSAFVTGFVVFLFAYLPRLTKPADTKLAKFFRVVDTFGITFTHISISLILSLGAYSVIQDSFTGLALDHWSASVLVGLTSGINVYLLYLSGANFSSAGMAVVLLFFVVSGSFASMLVAEDRYWWALNFSALGIDGSAAISFNITMMIAGIVLMTISNYLVDDLRKWQKVQGRIIPKRLTVLNSLLIMMGLMVALVGAINVQLSLPLHNLAAAGMAVALVIIILLLPMLLPGFPTSFYLFSYTILVGLAATSYLYLGVGYFNLTAFELIGVGLAFLWYIFLVRNISALTQQSNAQQSNAQAADR